MFKEKKDAFVVLQRDRCWMQWRVLFNKHPLFLYVSRRNTKTVQIVEQVTGYLFISSAILCSTFLLQL